MKRAGFNQFGLPVMLLLPQLLVIGVFFYWPAAYALQSSFYLEDPFGFGSTFVGIGNYADLLSSAQYVKVAIFTIGFTLLVTFLSLSIALLLAVKADKVIRGTRTYRTLLMWVYAVAPPVAGFIGVMVFYQGNGPVNFIFFLSGLQSIPQSVKEAAMIDNRSGVRRFWDITFPLLAPTAFFLLIINITYALFDTFGMIDTLVKGEPGNNPMTLVYKVYVDGFRGNDLGGSSAQSVILMVLVLVLTVFQFRVMDRRIHYT